VISKKKRSATSKEKVGRLPPSSRRQKKRSTLCEGYFEKRTDCWKVLRPLQKEGVDWIAGQRESALIFKQRLGKTYIACGVLERLRPQRTLLIVPLTNRDSTWAKKLRELVPHIPATVLPKLKRKDLLAAAKAFQEGVLVIHCEAFCSIAKQLRNMPWDLIISDETQRAKDRASLFSRRLAMMRNSFARKVIMTGTPIDEEPQDLWAQFRFLAPHVLGTSWKEFDQEFMEQAPEIDFDALRGRGTVRLRKALMQQRIIKSRLGFDFDKLPEFVKLIKPYCWFEELTGPKPVFHTIKVKMRGYQRRVYDRLKESGHVRLRDGTRIKPEVEVAKLVKLRQITSGFLYDEDMNVHWVGRAKMRKLMILLRDIPKPLPIFCLYRPELELLEELLPGRVGVLSGKVKGEDRLKVQEDFQAGKLDYILCQTRTGGVGIDLWRAKNLFVMSSNYSSIDFSQLIARIQLPDQTESVNIFLLIVEGSIDEERQLDVSKKNRRVYKVLNQLRRRA